MPSKMRDGPQHWSKSIAACLVVFYIFPSKSYVFSLFGPYGEKLPYAASVVFQIPYWGLVLWIMDC